MLFRTKIIFKPAQNLNKYFINYDIPQEQLDYVVILFETS